jgi:hypothetical protein
MIKKNSNIHVVFVTATLVVSTYHVYKYIYIYFSAYHAILEWPLHLYQVQ